jgi:hypothetical protein
MAKIVKSADAPEGDVKVSVGSVHFKVTDSDAYETTDSAVLEAGNFHPFLEVDWDSPDGDSRQQMKDLREVQKARDKALKQHAEKDPYEEAVPVPGSIEELHELEEEPADDEKKTKESK